MSTAAHCHGWYWPGSSWIMITEFWLRVRSMHYQLVRIDIGQYQLGHNRQLSVPQIEFPLGGSSKKGSHVYFLLHILWVILFCQIVLLFYINVLMLPWWPDVILVQSDITIVVPWQLTTGIIHDYLFCNCPLVGILFEALRIYWCSLNS